VGISLAVVGIVALAVCLSYGLPAWGTLAILGLLPLAKVTVEGARQQQAAKPPDGFGDWSADCKAIWYQAGGMISAAETEGRDFTEDEATELERLLAELKQKLATTRGRRSDPDSLGGDVRAGGSSGWVDADSGEPVRVYGPDERMASPEPEHRLDVGLLLRGMILGKWAGAEREHRALAEGLDTAGGYAVPAPLAGYILDLARANAVCIKAGMQTVAMDSDRLTIARLTGDATASWRAENAAIAESDPTFGAFTMTATSLAVMCKLPLELVADAPNVGEIVETALTQACGLGLDYGCLMGTGALQPTGIYNDSDCQELTSIGVPDHDDFIDAITAVREENHEPNAIVLHPTYWGIMAKTKTGDGEYLSGQLPEDWKRIPKFGSTQIPKTLGEGAESIGFVGDFSKLLLGLRQAATIEASREASDSSSSAFKNVQVWVRCVLRADLCISYAKAFCIMKGLTVS